MATPILVTDLTTGQIDGLGVFDKLMAATKPHIRAEYDSGRIKGADYSQVYLGAVQSAMSQSIEFLLRQESIKLQNDLLEQQALTEAQNTLATTAQTTLIEKQTLTEEKNTLAIVAQTAQSTAQTVAITSSNIAQNALTDKQTLTEIENRLATIAQTAQSTAQTAAITSSNVAQNALTNKQTLTEEKNTLAVIAQTAQSAAQTAAITSSNIAQNALTDKQTLTEIENRLATIAQTSAITSSNVSKNALIDKQTLTEIQNTLVATATKCKLEAEFDLLVQQKLRVLQETSLMARKIVTETAQTTAANIDATSVVGSQIALYTAQKDGFARDAEQKAAKLYFDTWNVRRTTDVTVATTTQNQLTDIDVGAVAAKLKTGIGI